MCHTAPVSQCDVHREPAFSLHKLVSVEEFSNFLDPLEDIYVYNHQIALMGVPGCYLYSMTVVDSELQFTDCCNAIYLCIYKDFTYAYGHIHAHERDSFCLFADMAFV